MINKKVIQAIQNQEMDRKEFLKYSGIVVVGLMGFRGLVSMLSLPDKPEVIVRTQEKQATKGFGSGRYGS